MSRKFLIVVGFCLSLLLVSPLFYYRGQANDSTPINTLLSEVELVPLYHTTPGFTTITSIIPYGDNDLLVATRPGKIYLFEQPVDATSIWTSTLTINISERVSSDAGELGFYSIAPSPDFSNNNTLYFSYTNLEENLVIERFNIETGTHSIVLTVPKPERDNNIYHRAGDLKFYDGLLYISVGDNAFWYGAPDQPSQDLNSLYGKILRIDVETNSPVTYTIPADNPFIGLPDHRPEIWSYGLRNPWKLAFDRNGNMVIAEVGQAIWEELNLIPAGENAINFGWNCYEGPDVYSETNPDCENAVNTLPIYSYSHGVYDERFRCAVTGGTFYEGNLYPLFTDMYIFTDFCESRVRAIRKEKDTWLSYTLGELSEFFYPTAIGNDPQGTIIIGGHTLYRLVVSSPTPTPTATPTATPTITPTPTTSPVLPPSLFLPLLYRD
jgi:glucose/arabinose dehydrogenase